MMLHINSSTAKTRLRINKQKHLTEPKLLKGGVRVLMRFTLQKSVGITFGVATATLMST